VVTEEAYSQAVQQRLEQMRGQSGAEITAADAASARRQALDSLVEQVLVAQEASKLGLTVSDEELAHAIQSSFRGSDGRFNESEYLAYLREQARQGVAQEQAEEAFRKQVQFRKVRLFLESTVHVTQPEVEEGTAKIQRRLKARLALALDKPLQAKQAVTEDELKDYYSQHRQDWEKPEQIRARHILVKVDPQAGAPTELMAKTRAEGLAKQARAGADFATLAKKNSDDEGSAKRGGDLGFFGRGMMVPEFEKAAFALKTGQVSDPVRSQYGWHVIKLEGRKAAVEPTFASFRAKARDALTLAKARQQSQRMAVQAQALLTKGSSLTEAAKAAKMQIVSTDWFDRKTAVVYPALGKEPSLPQALEDLDKGGRLPSPLALDKGFVLAELEDERKGAEKKLEPSELRDLKTSLRGKKAELLYAGWVSSLKVHAKISENLAPYGD
jgi:peptidyl-prolyl cis-trans isomerase D